MAIDLGTANTIIAVKGRGVVLDEPSLVAVNEITEEIVAFGQEAADMSGREGRDITVKAPLIGGGKAFGSVSQPGARRGRFSLDARPGFRRTPAFPTGRRL